MAGQLGLAGWLAGWLNLDFFVPVMVGQFLRSNLSRSLLGRTDFAFVETDFDSTARPSGRHDEIYASEDLGSDKVQTDLIFAAQPIIVLLTFCLTITNDFPMAHMHG
ncbi:hypothetical protein BKA67DRAFT_302897 [Truncatella angustata]|uniref:Uncharacterized protein n=1 Tax=Truncatella angustata TaxID=152316 RepID=A0A9P8UIP3_9PEZI|nr:uncharacterized protein BKA67DRAFT_302897 [Truncatella angustata]KAH6652867.1 hypothetical protein BKA67DRAFT_302897 [Truncatella angustata]